MAMGALNSRWLFKSRKYVTEGKETEQRLLDLMAQLSKSLATGARIRLLCSGLFSAQSRRVCADFIAGEATSVLCVGEK